MVGLRNLISAQSASGSIYLGKRGRSIADAGVAVTGGAGVQLLLTEPLHSHHLGSASFPASDRPAQGITHHLRSGPFPPSAFVDLLTDFTEV